MHHASASKAVLLVDQNMGIMKNSEETRFNASMAGLIISACYLRICLDFVCCQQHWILDSCLRAAVLVEDDMLPLLEATPKQDQSVLRALIRIPC